MAGLAWIDSARYAWPRPSALSGDGVDWIAVEAATGGASPLFDATRMENALGTLPGVSPGEAHRLAHSGDLLFDHKYAAALVTVAYDLYLYRFGEDRGLRLTRSPAEEELPSFSPDGRLVAFVREHNLFVVDPASAKERQLTKDSSPKILNGMMDWVYEEEIYGRGDRRAYWWSPDSSAIAFLRLDDGPVPTSTTVDSIPYTQTIEQWDYPKAGDPNPVAALGVVGAGGGRPAWIDTKQYSAPDTLIVRVGWTPDSRHVAYEVQNRTQSWLDLNLWDVRERAARTILRESSQHWIPADGAATPTWLKDGSFLWLSERSGWRHLYRYSADGSLRHQVTDGKWEVRTVHGVEESGGWIYFSGTEHSPIGEDVYRVRLDGGGMQRLSGTEGTHQASFSQSFGFFLDTWSNVTTPRQVRLPSSDGAALRVVDDNRVPALAAYRLSTPDLLQVTTRDGFVMEAMMIKPPDFNPSRRYPVFQHTYGGPHAPEVRNAWGGSEFMFFQLLAQKGVIVWVCDNRTASGKGAESTWPLSRRFGEIELRDIEDGVEWLKKQPYVDGARIGIQGWSYGGFMTSYALTHSTSFVMGAAGGTVGDWRNYDSVYTERFLGLPAENEAGYRASSTRWSAASLHGALMLMHGEIDDNVHLANTMQFAYELQKAGKPFQLMIYPKTRHGPSDPALIKHLREALLDFTLAHLKPAAHD